MELTIYSYTHIRNLLSYGKVTLNAVSYTHLDVYKRQALSLPEVVQAYILLNPPIHKVLVTN